MDIACIGTDQLYTFPKAHGFFSVSVRVRVHVCLTHLNVIFLI